MPESAQTDIVIQHPLGIHLRTGKDIVLVASRFESDITAQNLTRKSTAVNAKSILQLTQLQARKGHTLRLAAEGPDAQAALDAIASLLSGHSDSMPSLP